MFSVDDKPNELVTTGLLRARFCELLALATNRDDAGSFFTVGLLSIVDALLDIPMSTVVDSMTLSREMCDALLYQGGSRGEALQLALALERGETPPVQIPGLGDRELARLHLDAMCWADDSFEKLRSNA